MAHRGRPMQDLFRAEPTDGTGRLDRRFFLTQGMALLGASGLAAMSSPSIGAAEPPAAQGVIEGANVKDFGAVGDGVADDTAAIQQAINHVKNTDGGTVFFPAAVYLVSATLTVTAPYVTLLGPG